MKIADIDFLPVVHRELREGARRPFNYWLRVAGATAGVLLLYSINKSSSGNQAAEGLRLFTGLHEMLLVLICVMVPAMSADCIARETREGTLGLLFLTPLSAMGIVMGKLVVQAFRAFTLWLAVLPVIIIPFVSGGVTGGDAASAITIEFCVTLLCLAAGVLASSVAKARSTAFILAAVLAVCFIFLFAELLGLGFFWQVHGLGQPVRLTQIINSGEDLIAGQSGPILGTGGPIGWLGTPSGVFSIGGPAGPTWRYVRVNGANGVRTTISFTSTRFNNTISFAQPPNGWGGYFSAPATRNAWRSVLLQCWLAIPLLVLLVLKIAARRIGQSWHEKPPSVRRENWVKTYCLPLAKRRFARKMQRTLDWNPIAWLQQYSWKARTSKWGVCLVLVLLECVIATDTPSAILDAQSVLLLLLAACFTFVGVSSFLTEKKSGALELLLVTPVSPNQIIVGRVWGLWKQFLPAGLTLLFLWLAAKDLVSISAASLWRFPPTPGMRLPYVSGFVGYGLITETENSAFRLFVTALGFFTLPVFATYFALRVKNLMAAAALTWLALILSPVFAFSGLGLISGTFNTHLQPSELYMGILAADLAFALLAFFLLRHSLSRRIYSF